MNLICFGHLPWSPMWKRNQNMVYHLNKKAGFEEILFVNPYVRCTDLLLKFKQQVKNVVRVWSWKGVLPRMEEDVRVVTTVFLGPSRVCGFLNDLLSIVYLLLFRRLFCRKQFVLLVNDFEPDRMLFYRKLFPLASKIVVDLSDDFLAFGNKESKNAQIREIIDYSIAHADLVLCVNEQLLKKFDDGSGKFHVLGNGVSFEAFECEGQLNPFPAHGIGGPVIGYMGWISRERLDVELVEHLLRTLPHCSMVFLGVDVDGLCEELAGKYPNFHYIPSVPFDVMVRYVKNFDVAIIPHKKNTHTDGNSLLKLYVFMAAKVAIVSTDVSGVGEYAGIVDIQGDHDGFRAAVSHNLAQADPGRLQQGYEIAQEQSWSRKIGDFYETVFSGALS